MKKDIKQLLLDVLVIRAPAKKDKQWVRREYEGVSERSIAGAIYDGLAHGNWPWVVRDMIEQAKAKHKP